MVECLKILWEQLSGRQQTQRKFPRGDFNLRESLSQKNIASDLIYVEVLIQANIVSYAVRNFQKDGNRVSHPDDPWKTVEGIFGPLS